MLNAINKNLLYILATRAISIASLLLTLKFVSQMLGPEGFALVNLYTAIIGLISMVLINPVGQFYNREVFNFINAGLIKCHTLEIFKIYFFNKTKQRFPLGS